MIAIINWTPYELVTAVIIIATVVPTLMTIGAFVDNQIQLRYEDWMKRRKRSSRKSKDKLEDI